jgi:hypothetical protein
MKTLKKKYESENSCYTEAGREKPTRLTQRINQKYKNKYSNWSKKSNCIWFYFKEIRLQVFSLLKSKHYNA